MTFQLLDDTVYLLSSSRLSSGNVSNSELVKALNFDALTTPLALLLDAVKLNVMRNVQLDFQNTAR